MKESAAVHAIRRRNVLEVVAVVQVTTAILKLVCNSTQFNALIL
jgi:hypothetical protein